MTIFTSIMDYIRMYQDWPIFRFLSFKLNVNSNSKHDCLKVWEGEGIIHYVLLSFASLVSNSISKVILDVIYIGYILRLKILLHVHPTEQVIACFTYLRFILSHTLHTTTGPLQERITQALSLCCLLHICGNWGWMNLNNHFLEPQQIPNCKTSLILRLLDQPSGS